MKELSPLSPQVFHVLLTLYQKERHGYEIMKQVEADTENAIKLGPGTLYGIIKRLLLDGLIKDAGEHIDHRSNDERRKYYTLTGKGRSILGAEAQRLDRAVRKAAALGVDLQAAELKWAN